MIFNLPNTTHKDNKNEGIKLWAVIVLDRSTGDYLFYNSILPRSGVVDAVEMVNFCLIIYSKKNQFIDVNSRINMHFVPIQ